MEKVSEDVISINKFRWEEYAIFFTLLGASALIGLYYDVIARFRKKTSVEDYMLGGKRMPSFPVAISLVASFSSGLTMLGIPTEAYLYGTQIYGYNIAFLIAAFLLYYFYLPVFYHLQLNTIYEYLERRFDSRVRLLMSFVYTITVLTLFPLVLYIPALAFSQVTAVSINILIPCVSAVCIFYTTLGGLRGVIWTDTLQAGFTVLSALTVLILGIKSVGGLGEVLRINREGERLELFNMDPSPFARNTFWNTALGTAPFWVKHMACHPSSAQRFTSLPSIRNAKVTVAISAVGLVFIKTLTTAIGLVMYAKYYDCDPVHSKVVQRPGQILPLFVVEVSKNYPGLAGVFLSGIVSCSLSALSTGLNTVGGTVYEDFIKGRFKKPPTDQVANLTIKRIIVIFGVFVTAIVFVVQRMGTVMQVFLSLAGLTNGVQVYIFTLGIFFPWSNANGAIAGAIAGLVAPSVVMGGAQYYMYTGDMYYGTKVTSIEGCHPNITAQFNQTRFGHAGYGTFVRFSGNVPYIFRFSYILYSSIGFLTALTVALVVSLLTGLQDPSELDPNLVIPQLRPWMERRRRKARSSQLQVVYQPVRTAEIFLDNSSHYQTTRQTSK